MTWATRDGDAPDVVESRHENVKDAIAEALASGYDVFVHAEDCPPYNPLNGKCPCKPTFIRAQK